jgi:hypothetical protein
MGIPPAYDEKTNGDTGYAGDSKNGFAADEKSGVNGLTGKMRDLSHDASTSTSTNGSGSKGTDSAKLPSSSKADNPDNLPTYSSHAIAGTHTNPLIEASKIRAKDEVCVSLY